MANFDVRILRVTGVSDLQTVTAADAATAKANALVGTKGQHTADGSPFKAPASRVIVVLDSEYSAAAKGELHIG